MQLCELAGFASSQKLSSTWVEPRRHSTVRDCVPVPKASVQLLLHALQSDVNQVVGAKLRHVEPLQY